MKKIFYICLALVYLSFMSCARQGNSQKESSNEEVHNHEGHSHGEHDHGEESDHDHSHAHTEEANAHDHGDHAHSHDEEDHGHSHENESDHGHPHAADDHGHSHAADAHEGHDHGSTGELDRSQIRIVEVKKADFYEVIKASGQVKAAQADEFILTAKASGVVRFNGRNRLSGMKVKSNENLCLISSDQFMENNLAVLFKEAKAKYELAKNSYEREQKLREDQIISEQKLQETKAEYESASAVYKNLLANYNSASAVQNFPVNGVIKEVYVKEGDYVEVGQVLASITKNKRMLLHADVPQRFFSKLKYVKDAVFIPSSSKKPLTVSKLNGKLLSYGKHTEENSFFIPVVFEFDYQEDVLSGAFAAIYLKSKKMENVISIPKSSILEEGGSFYVYVEEGKDFQKHYVKLGGSDGVMTEIIKGLHEGDKVVSKGAYLVKLSTMSLAVPHGHSH